MSLPQRIKSYFDAAVTMDYDGPTMAHPIIVLNALKNIIGDNRNNPSQKLLDSMADKSEKYPQRTDDQKVLDQTRSEEHTSELQSRTNLVCRLLLEKKKKKQTQI